MYSLLLLSILFIILLGSRTFYSIFYGTGILILLEYLYSIYTKEKMSAIVFAAKQDIFRGERFTYEVVLQNDSFLPVFNVLVSIKSLEFEDRISYIGPFRQFALKGETTFEKRGRYDLGPVHIESLEPFKLFKWFIEIPSMSWVTVYPKIFNGDFILDLLRYDNGTGTLLKRHGNGISYNVRKYVPGDNLRMIHWKLSAKLDELQVKEYPDATKNGLRVLCDMRQNMYNDMDEENALSLLLTVVSSFYRHGIECEVLSANKEWRQYAIKNGMDFKELVEASVDIKFDGSDYEGLYRMISSVDFRPDVIIAPAVDADILKIQHAFDCWIFTVAEDENWPEERIITPSRWRGIFEESKGQADIYIFN